MKILHIIFALLLLVSCHDGLKNISDVPELSERIRPAVIPDTSLNHIDILMNREVTDMTLPWVNEGAAERYLAHNDKESVLQYNILSALASRQVGEYSKAYEHILYAQNLAPDDNNDYYSGLIWLGRYLMSQYMQDYTSAVNQVLKASEHFENLGSPSFDYKNYLLEAVRGYILFGRIDIAEAFIADMESLLDEMHPQVKAKYYDTLLSLYRLTDRFHLADILEMMTSEIDDNYIYWLNVAYTYSLTGRYDLAADALEKYLVYNSRFGRSVAYHGVRAQIMKNIGRHDEAISDLKIYVSGIEKGYQELIDSEILLKEQRMNAAMEKMRRRNTSMVLVLSIGLLICAGTIVLIILRRRLNARRKKLRDALEQRMSVFNKYILGKMLPNYSLEGAEKDLQTLIESKDTFLESTCRTFEALHPEFAAFIASCNLTDRERGCCYLYCMGMRGNEIATYLGLADNSYYNFSSTIRKKLGIKEYKTNLDFFLRAKMAEFDN